MRRSVAVLVCCLGAVQAFAEEPAEAPTSAWKTARWGMAPAEVVAAFPGEARRPENPDRYDDGPVLVEIPSLEIGEASYVVHFVFTEEKLSKIRVKAWMIPEPEAVKRYEFLLRMLSDSHGPPGTCSTDDHSKGLIQNVRVYCQWTTPSSRVTLERLLVAPKTHLALGVAKRPSGVGITYSPP